MTTTPEPAKRAGVQGYPGARNSGDAAARRRRTKRPAAASKTKAIAVQMKNAMIWENDPDRAKTVAIAARRAVARTGDFVRGWSEESRDGKRPSLPIAR